MSDIGTNDIVIDGNGPDRAGRLSVGGRTDAHQIRHILAGALGGSLVTGNFPAALGADGGTATASASIPWMRAGMKLIGLPIITTAAYFTIHGMARIQAAECAADGVLTVTGQNFNTATKTYNSVNIQGMLGIR